MDSIDKLIKLSLAIFLTLSFFSFGWLSHSAYNPIRTIDTSITLERIKTRKTLNVVLLNGPTTYYIGPDGPAGFEYDLLKAYADYLGVALNITNANTIKEAIEFSKYSYIDITSASFTKTKQREKTFNFGPSYFEVQEQVICQRAMVGSKRFPKNIDDLAGLNIVIGEGTSYSETVSNLQEDGYDINVTLTSKLSTQELLEEVGKKNIDCTIADSNIYAINQRYFPQTILAFLISPREQLAWVLAPNSKKLEANMYEWFNTFNQSSKLVQLKDHYYSYVTFFDYYDNKMFYKRVKSRLPKYKKYFVKYAEATGIPWTLIAAQSYQESHWNPKAKSFTGVRGLMMLTRRTAKMLGVKNRLDPEKSIKGGSRHLRQMIKNVPKGVDGDDRLKFALAAYNVGMGHILDARTLAKRMGLNHNIWSDLKKALPLLSQKHYYKDLKYGYARGSEPVKYVDSIYNYRDILQNIDEVSEEINNK